MSRARDLITGAALMYFLDPALGPRRRGLVRDRFIHLGRKLEGGLDAAARDARNRSVGLAARTRQRLRRDDAPDAVIEERIRSRIGRVVSHPGSIRVVSRDGVVRLSGPVLATEVKELLAEARSVRGVRRVHDELEVHRAPERVPGLQGAGRRPGARPEVLQENWTPALRLLMGGIGLASILGAGRSSGPGAVAARLAGSAMLARAATNLPTRRLVGVNAGRSAITLQKAISVDAPVERVWEVWTRFENFPRFMAHLEEVRDTGDGRSHWVATGPAGTRFEWDAEITRWAPHELIAWKSVDGAEVANAGVVRFERAPGGGTRIEVRLSYTPPAGALGHAIASVLGADAKRAMDEDLLRLKSLIELGRATANGETVTLESLER